MAQGEGSRRSRAGAPVPTIPDKLYFRIGEVARLLALPAHVLRFWESEFPHLRPYKGSTGQRLYRRRDVEALLEVRRLLYDRGYTIAGARQLLGERTLPDQAAAQTDLPAAAAAAHASSGALLQVYTGLRELSQLLHHPADAQRTGTHLATRKRAVGYENTLSLFAQAPDAAQPPGNEPGGEPGSAG